MGSKKSPKPPQLVAPRMPTTGETFSMFMGQGAQLPALEQFASTINEGFRNQLEQGLPGTIGATKQSANLVTQLLSGTPSADVQASAQRQLAERNLAAGLPSTSQAAIFGEAATFGTTSMALQSQGMSLVPGLLEVANYLSPQQAQNYLFSTGQLRSEQMQDATNQANVANQNAINKFNYDVQKAKSSGGVFGSIGGIVGGIGGAALGSVFPGIGTSVGASLGSMLGGSVGSYAGGGSFAPTGMGGAAGSLFGQLSPSVFGQGAAPTTPSYGGGGFGGGAPNMNFQAYAAPFTMQNMNMQPSSPGLYGGVYPMAYGVGQRTGF